MARTRTSWVKGGKSPNPGGRPRRTADVEAAARECTLQAIEALVKALASPRERVPAAIALLNRGWGMPKQNISGDKAAPLAVSFKWADDTSVAAATESQVIDAVAEQIAIAAEPVLAWEND
jgi:hypothetical protein